MRDLTAIMAPTINSYRRFSACSWAGATATWGVDNRSSGLRAISEGEEGTRLRHRQPGEDLGPYLGVAAALAGGLGGVERGLQAPPRTDADVYARDAAAARPLPRSLAEATESLHASVVARDWLGEDFIGHHVTMKRAEVDAAALAVTDWEVARYLEAL